MKLLIETLSAHAPEALAGVLEETDVHVLGEELRAATFPEHNPTGGEDDWAIGCYTTFDVREDAYPWNAEARRAFYLPYLGDPDDPTADEEIEWTVERSHGYSFDFHGLRADVLWHWDGDGILVYALWNGDTLLRAIENWDCKKNYVWRALSPDGVRGLEEARAVAPVVHLDEITADRSPRARPSVLADAADSGLEL